MLWLAIGAGGAIGAIVRHALDLGVHRWVGGGRFPVGIFLVNMAGCCGIGLLAGLVSSGRMPVTESQRLFTFVGLLGGFTTFSSYSLDTYALLREGRPGLALLNGGGQVVIGLAAVALGMKAAGWRG